MLPSERIRELEIQIHNQQPHLDRVVVCLRAIATYLDETDQVAILPESARVELISPTLSDTIGSITSIPAIMALASPPKLPPLPKPGDSK